MGDSKIINDSMSLEEKLAAIDSALKNAQQQADEEAATRGEKATPIDPVNVIMCEGCE